LPSSGYKLAPTPAPVAPLLQGAQPSMEGENSRSLQELAVVDPPASATPLLDAAEWASASALAQEEDLRRPQRSPRRPALR
jgi:hypothetical protein